MPTYEVIAREKRHEVNVVDVTYHVEAESEDDAKARYEDGIFEWVETEIVSGKISSDEHLEYVSVQEKAPTAVQVFSPFPQGRIIATLHKQAWNDRDYAVDLGEEYYDVTDLVLQMDLNEIHVLKDNDESTDWLGYHYSNHVGPHYVRVEAAIEDFFGKDFEDITFADLERKRSQS